MSLPGHKRRTGAVASANKRTKTQEAGGGDAVGVISQGLLEESNLESLRRAFAAGAPFPHVVLENVFDDQSLRRAREEVIHNLKADFKETDIFKVFQTGDLANYDSCDDGISNSGDLRAVRDAIYSEGFRTLVQKITTRAVGSQVDCSCNVYLDGGHLLCHDDVIRTRRVSYILYLTDPDDAWQPEDGGALELYPANKETGEPLVRPSKLIYPAWNSMVVFNVEPGVSYHAVQEVFSGYKRRLSLSGWFHADSELPGSEKATLSQLKMKCGEDVHRLYSEIVPLQAEAKELADLGVLRKWVNAVFLDPAAMDRIYEKFHAEGSIQLQDFLRQDVCKAIKEALKREEKEALPQGDTAMQGSLGSTGPWAEIGPPHKQRHMLHTAGGSTSSCGGLLECLKNELFRSPAFSQLLHHLTGVRIAGIWTEVRRFRPGLDYTVAHYGAISDDDRLDAVLCFVDDDSEEDALKWDSGDVGGFEAYLLADVDGDEQEAPEVYKVDDGDESSGVLNISAVSNTLSLVLRDTGLMRFVKYVSASAPSGRWDISAEYQLQNDECGGEGSDS
ncbi:unnamed protein product [Ostreobium quekettii]|uniref:Fe2OG dioxygenase domain-containing protein n=1 Tax=Ostreobium quekettii TaxID=121088 RepID=A0A8S1JG74_9CHLO|nr:unnamed protein product [Ostreobium quekettii]